MELISHTLDEPMSRILGVLTFYSFFSTVPRGKYVLRVCLGTACYVKGGERILSAFAKDVNLEPGDITEDGKFSLETVRCLGACGLSPVLSIDGEIHGRVKPNGLEDILAEYK